MNKTFIVFMIFLLALLTSCKTQNPIICDIGFVLENGECVEENPVVCDDDYELIAGECEEIELEIECEEDYVISGDKCIYDISLYENSNDLQSLDHDGKTRKYLLYIPEGYDVKNMPLVMVLHGYTGTAYGIRTYSNFNSVADRDGFAVVYPQGLRLAGATHFNVGLDSSDVDDVGFLSTLIDHLQDKFLLSEENTFITGMSNGGYMSYTMVIDYPDYFKAMASVGGVISYHSWQVETYQQMNILQIHGTKDYVVPIDGSWPYDNAWGDVPGLDVLLGRWKTVNGTTTNTTETISESTILYKYTNPESNLHVWYYEIDGYGHAWPINRQQSQGVDPGFHATEAIWDFFSQFIEESE